MSDAAQQAGDPGGQQQQTPQAGDPGGQQQTPQAGQQEPIWSSIQDEGVRGLMETKGYDSYDKLANAYSNLNKMFKSSPDVVGIPGEDADEETLRGFYRKLGAPEEPSNYDLKIPEDQQIDEDFLNNSKNWMHKIGLNNRQAQALADEYQKYFGERAAQTMADMQRTQEAQLAEIQKEFGSDLEGAVARGKAAAKAFGLENELLDDVEKVMGAPALMKMLAKMGEKIGKEDVRLDGIDKSGEGFAQSVPQMKQRMAEMRGNPEIVRALATPSDPNHIRYSQEWNRLNEQVSIAEVEAERKRYGGL